MEQSKPASKLPLAEEIFGLRRGGIRIQFPFELDYACPICCAPISEQNSIFTEKGQIKPQYMRLQFSEYNAFMWCEHCNLDIPSFLCLHSTSVEMVKNYTHRFLQFGKDFREQIYQKMSPEEADCQKLRERVAMLEKRNMFLEGSQKLLDYTVESIQDSRVLDWVFKRKWARRMKKLAAEYCMQKSQSINVSIKNP